MSLLTLSCPIYTPKLRLRLPVPVYRFFVTCRENHSLFCRLRVVVHTRAQQVRTYKYRRFITCNYQSFHDFIQNLHVNSVIICLNKPRQRPCYSLLARHSSAHLWRSYVYLAKEILCNLMSLHSLVTGLRILVVFPCDRKI